MKASLKKDVIAVRLVTLLIIVVIVAIIGSVVSRVSSHKKQDNPSVAEVETEESTEVTQIVIPDAPEATEIYVKTIKSVNLRASADTSADVLAVLPADTQMLLVNQTDGWAEVMYGDQDGFVSSDYIVQVVNDITDTAENVETTTKVTTDSVRLRSEANTDCDVLTTLAVGTEVEVVSESDGWSQVTVDGQTGYVKSEYLQ